MYNVLILGPADDVSKKKKSLKGHCVFGYIFLINMKNVFKLNK